MSFQCSARTNVAGLTQSFDFLDKICSTDLKSRGSRYNVEAKALAAQWVIVQEFVRSIFQKIATVIPEENPRASWAQMLAIQDLAVGLLLQQLPELYSYSSPVILVLKREFAGLTYESRARGAFMRPRKELAASVV